MLSESLETLYLRIVDAFEPGTPTVLFWIAHHSAAKLESQYAADAATLLRQKVTPKGYGNAIVEPGEILTGPSPLSGLYWFYKGLPELMLYKNAIKEWWQKNPPHHDLFVRY